jgi:predicted RNA-binding Zn-ribbon protein involved in translation (DUF1610 family)
MRVFMKHNFKCKACGAEWLRVQIRRQYTARGRTKGREAQMVLIYENDPLDDENARGRFYHVCRGRIDRTEIQLPAGESVYECPACGIDLEAEDFWIARQKGSV